MKSRDEMTERLCQEIDAKYLAAFLLGSLIPLDKKSGVRPIEIGEVIRRVIGRILMNSLEKA